MLMGRKKKKEESMRECESEMLLEIAWLIIGHSLGIRIRIMYCMSRC